MKRFSYSIHFGAPDQNATETVRPFATNEQAKVARDTEYKRLKALGFKVRRSVLKRQLRKYWSFGVPCGIVANCYELEVY
jgi:hypothetical protein